jgi:hypothetical protein
MKKIIIAILLLMVSVFSYAVDQTLTIPNIIRLDTSQTNGFAPAAIFDKYMVYCNSSGIATGLFLPAEVRFETPVTTTAVISYFDGVIGSTGVHRFNATLTYTDATRATLSISGCPIIQ